MSCIGILGGAFDPVHEVHIRMAEKAMEYRKISKMLMVLEDLPLYKTCSAPADDRWKMLVAECSRHGHLVPARHIIKPGEVQACAYHLLLRLHEDYPKAHFCYIIGADSLVSFRTWRNWEKLLPLCSFLVFPRAGVSDSDLHQEKKFLKKLGMDVKIVSETAEALSSTEIRRTFSDSSVPDGISVPTAEFCFAKGLYGLNRRIPRSEAWFDRLFADLKPKRYAHSLSVAFEARLLAERFGIDPQKAEEAGILHDCAKSVPLEIMRRLAIDNRLTDDPEILSNTALLHSYAGALIAEKEYGMRDPEILDAIRYHNTGMPGMSRLAMCINLADTIEPCRPDFPSIHAARAMAETSLEKALLVSLSGTAMHVRENGEPLHHHTSETIQWLKTLPGIS